VLQLEPGNVDALHYRGTVYEKLGCLDEAISDFTAVLTLDPNHVKASYARGACRNLKGDFQKAIGGCMCCEGR
jgi:regulator of sirC expression with transglutaminase-like and TPR domain